jgi:hypothetical protein
LILKEGPYPTKWSDQRTPDSFGRCIGRAMHAAVSTRPVPRSEQEAWRERPRCARWKWPRVCPEGSLTPCLSVSCVGRLSVCGRSWNRCESGHMCARNGRRSSGRSGPVRAGNPGHKVALVPRAMTRLIRRPRWSRSLHAFGRASEQRAAPRRMRRPSRSRCSICARHRARLVASLRPRMRAAFGP